MTDLRVQNQNQKNSGSQAGWGFAVTLCTLLLGILFGGTGCGKVLGLGNGDSTSSRKAVNTTDDMGAIYPVSIVIPAEELDLGWTAPDFPFVNVAPTPADKMFGLGEYPVKDAQAGIMFTYTYPANNFQLAEAHLILDTSRDNSDTEGIMIGGGVTNNGVFSGYPANFNGTSTKVGFKTYQGNGAACENRFFNTWAVTHYRQSPTFPAPPVINTFDLNLAKLLQQGDTVKLGCPSPETPVQDLVTFMQDGVLPVVTGDDTPLFNGFLVLTGYTISDEPLTCSTEGPYDFQNVYVHNDGSSTGSFFTGNNLAPMLSWASFTAPQSAEMNYEVELPRVKLENIAIGATSLSADFKRQTTGKAALVVNGVGIAETGFSADVNSPTATAEVVEWITDAGKVALWETFVATIPATGVPTAGTLNLYDIFGATKIKSLISQGKLNITIAGSLAQVFAQNTSATRAPGTSVQGPELTIDGTFYSKNCSVPSNPDSPLSGAAPVAPTCPESQAPGVSSIQAVEVTDTTAKIIWLTDEPGDSTAKYSTGTAGDDDYTLTSPITANDPDNTKVFHEVTLTGLNKYTIYFYRAQTEDTCGNITESKTFFFRTKR